MLVKEWMTADPLTLQAKDSLMHARVMMKRHSVRHLPVLSGTQLVGLLSDRDLRNYTPSYCSTLDVYEMHYMISKLTVDDAMTPRPVTVAPETTMARAGELMIKKKIGSLPVEKDGKVVGILTETDVIRALVSTDSRISVSAPVVKAVAGAQTAVDSECK